ncbi:MAG: hypothetical protein ACM36C_16650 [Acidobacteriota bacterium]
MIKRSRGFQYVFAAMAVAAVAAPAVAQQTQSAADKRRYDLPDMDGALVGAVRHGAEVLGAQLKPFNPSLVLLTGTARARGFMLDGYGAFFDVEIPALRESVAWSIRTMAMEPDPFLAQWVANLRRIATTVQDPAVRARLEQNIAQMEQQLHPGAEPPAAAAQGQPGAARRVSSASVAQDEPQAPAAPSLPDIVKDPNALYTETVKNALIDAMLDYSGPMGIGPEEWLTVAARDAEGPLNPGEPYDAVTIVIRIKGSDLAAFRAERITREEARKRVEVREI